MSISHAHPDWWSQSFSSPWERARIALRRDLDQTWADLGLGEGQDLNQSVADTVRQAIGVQLIPPDHVPNMAVLSDAWADEAIRARDAAPVESPPVHAQWSRAVEADTPAVWSAVRDDEDVWERALQHIDSDPGRKPVT